MQVTKSQIEEWHKEGLALADSYLRAEPRMVELLSFIAGAKGYFFYQCGSLKSYALSAWKLPDNTARDMVTIARKALEIPELVAALKRGRSSLTKLRRICSVITKEDQAEWIDVAERCTKQEIEKLIAAARPEKAIQEGFFYRTGELLEMRAGVSENVRDEILRVQDLLSQKENRAVTLGETLKFMAGLALEKIDPMKKAERAGAQDKRGPGRISKSVALVHAINLRDQAQCTHIDQNGKRCPNRRWLHFHHIQPRSEGGKDTLENLVTLCSQHHRLVHHSSQRPTYHH